MQLLVTYRQQKSTCNLRGIQVVKYTRMVLTAAALHVPKHCNKRHSRTAADSAILPTTQGKACAWCLLLAPTHQTLHHHDIEMGWCDATRYKGTVSTITMLGPIMAYTHRHRAKHKCMPHTHRYKHGYTQACFLPAHIQGHQACTDGALDAAVPHAH